MEIRREKLGVEILHSPLPGSRYRHHVRNPVLPSRLLPELLGRHGQHGVLGQHLLIGEGSLSGEQVGVEGGSPAQTSGVKLLNLDADDKVADPCTTPAPRLPGSALPIRLLIVLTASNDRSGCARTK